MPSGIEPFCSINAPRAEARHMPARTRSTGRRSTWLITSPTSNAFVSISRSGGGSSLAFHGDQSSGPPTLNAIPSERRPLVLAAVSTGTAEDIDWLTVQAGRFFPAEWHAFREHVPSAMRDLRLVDAYNILLMDPDPAVHNAAATAWCQWEEAHGATTPSAQPSPRYDDAAFRLGFARQVTHCWRNASGSDRAGRRRDSWVVMSSTDRRRDLDWTAGCH